MLVLKLEMWPFGQESEKREIATMHIINNGSHNTRPKFGNYDVIYEETRYEDVVKDHNREDVVWKLVFKALYNLLHKRKVIP